MIDRASKLDKSSSLLDDKRLRRLSAFNALRTRSLRLVLVKYSGGEKSKSRYIEVMSGICVDFNFSGESLSRNAVISSRYARNTSIKYY